ncbi:MAG: penicillin-binding protein [Acidobacteriota bacterium]
MNSIPLARLVIIYGSVLLWGVLVLTRLVQLQVVRSADYRLQAQQQQIGYIELSPRRGDILDRHLGELAISVQMESVFAHPREVSDPAAASELLAPILGQHRHEIYKKLISDRSFVYLARKIPPRQTEQIAALKLSGVYLHEESKRVYPGRELAAHILGFVGMDNEGLAGLEYLYDDRIKGEKRRIHLRVDARRQSYDRESSPQQTSGNTVVLNIDRSIQFIVEQALRETVEKNKALNGSAIIMNPQNGEILALASHPPFNPNRYTDYDVETRRNRAILEIYEPGSTFKAITLAAVLNEGLADPMEIIDCEVGTLRLAGKVYREAKHSYGLLSFRQVLAKSSNVGTIKFALRLGEEKLYEYIRRFGFGEQTGIELPGEQAGLLRPPSQWSRISIGALSIGQELGVTSLQMVRSISAIANGGYLLRPRLVRQILTPEGDLLFRPEQQIERILSAATAQEMKSALSLVVDGGTGSRAALTGYSSAGKTGTAQKFIDGAYSRTRYVASYLGFAPVHEPALAAVVVINEPLADHYYGGLVAAPAFQQIMEQSLIHLKVPQDQPVGLEFAQGSPGPPELPAPRDISVKEDSPEDSPPEELEQTVLTLIEDSPALKKSSEIVALASGWFELPDFAGLSMRNVARECARLGLRLKVSGSGVAVGQRPAAGSRVFTKTVCEVFFSTKGQNGNASDKTAHRTSGE